ncbi:long-chain-fatty-acid--CoA ligase [Gordonia humi]|uniref:Fatty-acyl-CoA synthase n=1 Tax=Gordonia humi TaxID=686429 RepID=A0A840F2R2_9ACTN|nr:long-chain-fatty-acid--CoA ligase [Gordonia humi]MBB4138202.1 fatty-acyl-CoA synthase [Gordonia humi]
MSDIVKGMPSGHGDSYQLNTTSLIRHAARTYPEQEIVFRNRDGSWGRYTYADCYTRVQRGANLLRSLGVEAGDVVGILDWNSRRHFESYWSIPGIGAVMLQMNLRLAQEDLSYVTDHSGASVVLVDETLLPVAEALATQSSSVREWVVMTDKPLTEIKTSLPRVRHFEDLLARAEPVYDWPVIDETSTYSACYTTGTTGNPKGVYYSHRGIYLHTMAQAANLRMCGDDAAMIVTPMFHAQAWGLPQSAVYSATKIVLPGQYRAEDTSTLVDAMITEDVTVVNGAPVIFQPMLDYIKSLDSRPDFGRARLLSGSTEPALSLMRDFFELTGADIIHAYGATETGPTAAVNIGLKRSLQRKLTPGEKWDMKRSQGLPLNGIDVRIVDAEGRDLPHDGVAQGEILLRGPWIAESYRDLDDDTERFLDGYWRSGDVGTISPDGYIKLTDRLKDVIKSGGEWISSIDMENAIVGHPAVVEAAVIGVPHPKWQERPVALVVTADRSSLPIKEVHGLLADRFAKWQLPETVLYVDALPRTSVGKIDKKALRATYSEFRE